MVTTYVVDTGSDSLLGSGSFHFYDLEWKEGMMMKIIDAHCDVLLKMVQDESNDFYKDTKNLQVQFNYLEKSDVALQVFALFVPLPSHHRCVFTLP